MFRTPLEISPSPDKITHHHGILTLGSCFSQCMGALFDTYKFHVAANPFGTVFNPLSVHKLLHYALDKHSITKASLTRHNEVWSHYDFQFSSVDPAVVVKGINEQISRVHEFLSSCDIIVLTYGTAFVYELKENGASVANCHKHPADKFSRRLLSADEVRHSFSEVQARLPEKRFILTVSPVRHIRDTLPLNGASKSTLRVACHHLQHEFTMTDYFPSYEIMLDDLRDYRFYGRDMIHPTTEAEEYIWKKFGEAYFDEKTMSLNKKIQHILTRINHRPGHPRTSAHRIFLEKILTDLREIDGKVDFSREITNIKDQLATHSS